MPSDSVFASIVSSGTMAAVKFTAAAFSGSAAMFAEGVRSAVGCGNNALMALGQRRSRKPPDELHPFGYGKELYFWTLIVATFLFAVTGGGTVAKGVLRLLHPQELKHVGWSYAVLALAACLAAYSWWKAFKEFRAGQGGRTFARGVEKAKDPTTLTVLFGNSADLVGLAIAFLGLLLAQLLHAPVIDGMASVLIGLLMAAVSVGLMYQSKQLLVGESATAELKEAIRTRIERDGAVAGVEEMPTMQLSPKDVLAIAVVRFKDGLTGEEVGAAIGRLIQGIKADHPEVRWVYLQPRPVEPPTRAVSPGSVRLRAKNTGPD
jgi:cation diffusion facilitator family transporter